MPNDDMPAQETTIADVTVEQLKERITKVAGLLDQIDDEMKDAVELADNARLHALRMREGEYQALAGVLDYAEARPAVFTHLADKDGGNEPRVFETGLLRQRLTTAQLLEELAARIEQTRRPIADSALYLATLAKPPVLAAYEIAKPLARNDDVHGKLLNPALNLYGAIGKASAATRKAKKK